MANSHIQDLAPTVCRKSLFRSKFALCHFHSQYIVKLYSVFRILTFRPMVHSYGKNEYY